MPNGSLEEYTQDMTEEQLVRFLLALPIHPYRKKMYYLDWCTIHGIPAKRHYTIALLRGSF